MGGDVMGKLTIPIIREAGGSYRATVHGRVERVSSDAEVAAIRRLIGDLGFYDVVMDEDEYRATQADPEAVEAPLRAPGHRAAASAGSTWPKTRLAGTGIKVYATGGNDDLTEVMATMDRHGHEGRSSACEDRAVPLDDDHVMISMPYVNPTPWKTPARGGRGRVGETDRRPSRRRSRITRKVDLQFPRAAGRFDA